MTGRLFAFVGPSGVGKDTVMEAFAASVPDLTLVRRVITRPSDAGGEDFEGVEPAEFEALEADGTFALSWRAHGLAYGIRQDISGSLTDGSDMAVNLSRRVIADARKKFATLTVVRLSADRAVLARRLAMRGRETEQEIAARLSRDGFPMPEGCPVVDIDNSGALSDTIAALTSALYPERLSRCI